jgi:bacterioferritin (cytochrome b1)
MAKSPNMSSGPMAIVDSLNSLVEAELNSLFRFMTEGSPYLNRASAEMRAPLLQMVAESERHAEEIATLIESLNGTPALRSVQPEEQYLSYLSIKFLLPKLLADKKLMIERYENVIGSLGAVDPAVLAVLKQHIADHQADIVVLEKAAADAVMR